MTGRRRRRDVVGGLIVGAAVVLGLNVLGRCLGPLPSGAQCGDESVDQEREEEEEAGS